jgi:hypothetical protein
LGVQVSPLPPTIGDSMLIIAEEQRRLILEYILSNPKVTLVKVARKHGVTEGVVRKIAKDHNIVRYKKRSIEKAQLELPVEPPTDLAVLKKQVKDLILSNANLVREQTCIQIEERFNELIDILNSNLDNMIITKKE